MIETIIGARNAVSALRGEIQSIKLGWIWGSCTPAVKQQLLKEYPDLFQEFADSDARRARNKESNARTKAWFKRNWKWAVPAYLSIFPIAYVISVLVK